MSKSAAELSAQMAERNAKMEAMKAARANRKAKVSTLPSSSPFRASPHITSTGPSTTRTGGGCTTCTAAGTDVLQPGVRPSTACRPDTTCVVLCRSTATTTRATYGRGYGHRCAR